MGAPRIPPTREVRRDFDLQGDSFVPWPVGFESECWIVDERWFIKVWRDHGHPVDLNLPIALAVVAGEVGDSAGGWAADGGVVAVIVVAVEPGV